MREMPCEVLVRLAGNRRPGLPASQVSDNGEEMAPVRELDDKPAAGSQDSRDLPEHLARIAEVDEQANRNDHVNGASRNRQVRGVGGNDGEPSIRANAVAGSLDHRGRGVHQRHGVERTVLVHQSAEPRPKIEEMATAPGQERSDRQSIAAILVRSRGPELVAVRQVIAWGSSAANHVVRAAGKAQRKTGRLHVDFIALQPESMMSRQRGGPAPPIDVSGPRNVCADRRSSSGQSGRLPGAAPATVTGERRGPAIHNAADQSPSAAMTTGMSGRYEPVVSKAIAPTYTASVPPTG